MDEDRLESTLRAMRDDWDRRARENARYYVATLRSDWTDDEFFASGEQEIYHSVLTDMGNVCHGQDPSTMRVLEIGCGAGRVTRALAKTFAEVHAVDVSGEMVARARQAVSDLPNAFVYQNNGMDLSVVPDLPFDFAFSVIVFQHIPSRGVIENYFREISRLLRPGALFKVQVQGLPEIAQPKPEPAAEPALPLVPAPALDPGPEPTTPAELPLRWRLTGKIPLPIRKRFLRPIRRWMLRVPSGNPAAPAPALPPPQSPELPQPPEPYFAEPDTWVGVMFTPEYAQAVCDNAGFELRHQRGAGEQEYWLWCFKK